MAESLKVLGQVAPSATTLTALYTVPGATTATVSTISVCNRGATKEIFRVSISVGGAGDSVEQYIYYDQPLLKNDSIFATIGVTLGAADVVRVYSSSANFSFNLFGVEVT